MLIAKLILMAGFIYRMSLHIKQDESYKDKEDKTGARLATFSIFIVTILLYYFAGIFNLTAVC